MENKQLITCSVQEFIEALRQGLGIAAFEGNVDSAPQVKKHYVFGLAGLAQLLGCSQSSASRIHRSGVIAAATKRSGRILIFDADLVMDLLSVKARKHSF